MSGKAPVIENGLKTWLIRISTSILMLWSAWATNEILDLKSARAYTDGQSKEFQTNVVNRLVTIETKIDRIYEERK